ncbi:hypothetical protein [uncultured Thiocystis sp.]|jgi:hypothetical protein|nr:hypothetical protein [uncultured Thiocystis sp.]
MTTQQLANVTPLNAMQTARAAPTAIQSTSRKRAASRRWSFSS